MQERKVFSNHGLTIEVVVGETVVVVWRGTSISRRPGEFVLPILSKAIDYGVREGKEIVFDFCALEYMNSTTITPLIRILRQAKESTARIKVLYEAAREWQSLSFTALEVFQTHDQRIRICPA